MELLTVARKAKLGQVTKKNFVQTKEKLQLSKEYNVKVFNHIKNDKKQLYFHFSVFLTGIVSILEAYITDTFLEYLLCYPGFLDEKNIKLDDIAKSGSIGQVIKTLAEKTITNFSYKSFSEYHEKFAKCIDLEGTLPKKLLNEISEIKATRDIYVHANGRCNDIYLKKSGTLSRASIGEELPLSIVYIEKAIKKIDRYVSDVYNLIPARIKNCGSLNAFKDMWDLSHMSSVLSFDDAWETVSDSMIRPKSEALEWGWSSSEKAAFDFFLGIYSPQHPRRETDLMYALYRWPPDTSVGKVIISWMDSPFWF
jgi:hypothetical protein